MDVIEVIEKRVPIRVQEFYHLDHLDRRQYSRNQHGLAQPTGHLEGPLCKGHGALYKLQAHTLVLAWPASCALTVSFSPSGMWSFTYGSHNSGAFCDPGRGLLFFCPKGTAWFKKMVFGITDN